MSTRTVSVKNFNNNKHHHHNPNNANPHVTSLKPITNNKKNQQHHSSKKNPKLQATQHHNKHSNNNNNNQSKRRSSKATSSSASEDDTSSSSSEDDMSPKPSNRRSNNNNNNNNKRHSFEYKSLVDQVYAGPTFNNAPAPSALPIPAFNARGSPINYHQPLYHPVNPTFHQQSMDLMNLINTPQKVATAYELEQTNLALSEIQRGLRSMLKIES